MQGKKQNCTRPLPVVSLNYMPTAQNMCVYNRLYNIYVIYSLICQKICLHACKIKKNMRQRFKALPHILIKKNSPQAAWMRSFVSKEKLFYARFLFFPPKSLRTKDNSTVSVNTSA